MESQNLHDHDQLQHQQFVGSYSSPASTQSCHEWIPSISLDESFGSNYTPTISTSLNHQDSFFQHQWHTENFSFDLHHDLTSTELQLSSASLMFPNTTITTATRHDHHFDHVFPSTTINPTSDYGSTMFPRLNLKAFDLFTSSYDGEISSSNHQFQPLHGDSPTESSNQISSKGNGITSTKRPANKHMEFKESNSTNTKKTKSSMPRSPCPTLKVRKEKLGDRIAALQKLVAPFGKTDTASVLNEAIGYIQFLHDQVQTLTVPYMDASRARKMSVEEGREELERDLRSSGLSLVSHDCASFFIRSYNGSSI